MSTWMPSISCKDSPLTISELTIGKVDPPITLQPGQWLAVLSPSEVAAFEVDCMIGESSKLIQDKAEPKLVHWAPLGFPVDRTVPTAACRTSRDEQWATAPGLVSCSACIELIARQPTDQELVHAPVGSGEGLRPACGATGFLATTEQFVTCGACAEKVGQS